MFFFFFSYYRRAHAGDMGLIFPPKYLYYLSTTPYITNRRNKNCALAIPNENCEYNSQNFVYLLWQKSTAPTREVDIWGLNLCSSETPINQKENS